MSVLGVEARLLGVQDGSADLEVAGNRITVPVGAETGSAAGADVAAEAGVARSTVSKVVNGTQKMLPETTQRVWKAVSKLGYQASPHAQSLSTGRTKALGIVILDILNPHFTGLVKGAGRYAREEGRPWLADFVQAEREAGTQVIHDLGEALSVVPPFARYTYETWVLPSRPVSLLSELTDSERLAFARVLKDTLLRLDALFSVRMPYLLTVHQAPLDGQHPEFPLHIEIYPYLRAPGRMKYLAGTEQGAGEFANDKFPELAARELRQVQV